MKVSGIYLKFLIMLLIFLVNSDVIHPGTTNVMFGFNTAHDNNNKRKYVSYFNLAGGYSKREEESDMYISETQLKVINNNYIFPLYN